MLAENANSTTAATVYYGTYSSAPIPWRVIGYNGNGVATANGSITLLAGNNLGTSQFHGSSNHYSGSTLRTKVNKIADGFQSVEQAALIPRTLAVGTYSSIPPYCNGIAGDAVTGALLWPLSTGEADGVHSNIQNIGSFWWLRSPGIDVNYAALVYSTGYVYNHGYLVSIGCGVRPALHLNLSSVLFTSAAAGGKSSGNVDADALTQVLPYTGSEWKLTLHDADRDSFAISNPIQTGQQIDFSYTNAKTGSNEYLSAVVVDGGNNILYYGRILALDGTNHATAGNATLTLPNGVSLGNGNNLKLFNEQWNGDKKTDYSSPLLTVTPSPASFGLSTTPAALDFGSLTTGYTQPAAQTVTLKNTGNVPVTLNAPTSPAAFDIENFPSTEIEANTTASFDVRPKAGLPANSYSETLSISGTNGASTSVSLKFEVKESTYSLVTTPGSLTFGSAYPGYPAPAAQTVQLSNKGNQTVTVNLPTSSKYNISANGVSGSAINITSGAALDLSIAPKTGLSAGNHDENISITGTNGASTSVQLRFTITERLYTLSTTPSSLSFGSVNAGYAKLQAQTITVTNTGNQAVTLNQPAAGAYEIGTLSKATLAPNETATFTVTPKIGLSVGSYDETLTVSGSGGAGASVKLSFTVLTLPSSSGSSYTPDSRTEYRTIEGAGGTWKKGSSEGYRFGFEASFSLFEEIRIDGGLVDKSNYESHSGSTIVTLKPKYLESLSLGKHTVRAGFSDGYAQSSFSIAEADKAKPEGSLTNPFSDVTKGDWFYDDVLYIWSRQIMKGTGETTFSPNANLTRGMMATILWQMEKSPSSSLKNPYTDLASDRYYTAAVLWASEKGLFHGYPDQTFRANDPITREQLAVILHQFAAYKGANLSASRALSSFADGQEVSPWAQKSIEWAVGSGLMSGKSAQFLDPKGTATRAEVSSMLRRFLQRIAQ